MASGTLLAGHDYAYGYGRMGVLQQQLLTKADVDRLLACYSEEELLRTLGEIKFTMPVSPLPGVHTFVSAMERWLRRELETMVPKHQRGVFEILWLREDAPILAHLLKEHHGLTSGHSEITRDAVTTFPISDLEALVLRGDASVQLPTEWIRAVMRLRSQNGISPQEIDTAVSHFVAQRQVEAADQSGSTLIRQYVAHLIDLHNIRTVRRLPKDEPPAAHLLKGGEIEAMGFTTDSKHVLSLIRQASIRDSVSGALLDENATAVDIERALNKALAHNVAQMRGIPLGIEPIFAYAVMAISQIYLVRTILIGRSVGLSTQEIDQILPPFFSTAYEQV